MRYKYATGELLPKPKPTITATIYLASVALLMTSMCLYARAQRPESSGPALSGIVADTTGAGISGATIAIKGTPAKTLTDDQGWFTLRAPEPRGTLVVSYIGHRTITERFDTAAGGTFHFTLIPADNLLEEVEVSTGYQSIPKERATGSFVHIDNELLNRSVGSNVLDRLRGVTRGMMFNDIYSGSVLLNQSTISIRGRSTIEANPEPLIVLDNFPYEGDINSINPDDIESVTVLQDAAAASVWGAYAGNGVIVLTSRTGRVGQKTRLEVSSNMGLGENPNLYYTPVIPIREYIEVERFLFGNGVFDGRLNQGYVYVSPVVEALADHRNGNLDDAGLEEELNRLGAGDARQDLSEYVYRGTQQFRLHAALSGGTATQRFHVSTGYDRNGGNTVNSNNSRMSFAARHEYGILGGKLRLETSMRYSNREIDNGPVPYYGQLYNRLAGDDGAVRSIGGGREFRQSYIDTAGAGLLQDWNYRPLEELRNTTTHTIQTSTQLHARLVYHPLSGIAVGLAYQYSEGREVTETYESADAFAVRSEVNRFSQINRQTGEFRSAVPLGGRKGEVTGYSGKNYLRLHAEVDRSVGADGHIAGIVGMELNDGNTSQFTHATRYGYQPETETYTPVSYTEQHAYYYLYNAQRSYTIPGIPFGFGETTVDRNVLYFGNLAYTYRNRYTASFSARKDASNLFGVDANLRGRPFWSAGLRWKLSDEPFYRLGHIADVALRASAGVSGNISKQGSAYVTAYVDNATSTLNGNRMAQTIMNPPNPRLTWEKVHMYNIGMDVVILNGRMSLGVEGYRKIAADLLSEVPYRPSSGVTSFYGNWSSLSGSGWDVSLRTKNLDGRLQWTTDVIVSKASERITEYKLKPANDNGYLVEYLGMYPIEGKPMYPIFSFPSLGLDGSGRPRGLVEGQASTDYLAIYTGTPLYGLVYHGQATPAVAGGVRNSFRLGPMDFSFNITFKLDYYFRRKGMSYTDLYSPSGNGAAIFQWEYSKRWQQPGDELRTSVPAAVYPTIPYMDGFYAYSSDLVEKGDHIRWNDVQLGYQIRVPGWRISSLRVNAYCRNIGILWRSNDEGIDPDMVPAVGLGYPAPREYSLGFTLQF